MNLLDDPRIKELTSQIDAAPTGAERNKLTNKLIKLTQKIGGEEKAKLIYLNRMARKLAEMGDIDFATDVGSKHILIKTNAGVVKQS